MIGSCSSSDDSAGLSGSCSGLGALYSGAEIDSWECSRRMCLSRWLCRSYRRPRHRRYGHTHPPIGRVIGRCQESARLKGAIASHCDDRDWREHSFTVLSWNLWWLFQIVYFLLAALCFFWVYFGIAIFGMLFGTRNLGDAFWKRYFGDVFFFENAFFFKRPYCRWR